MTSSSAPPIAVIGAGGAVGRRVCGELAAAAAPFSAVARRAIEDAGAARIAVADATDPATLARAIAGARVVVNCAGPLRDTASPVLIAALAAGACYVDAGGEQAVARALYERHESAARRAGVVALPGAGLDCVIGDLAAGWIAAQLCEADAGGDASDGAGGADADGDASDGAGGAGATGAIVRETPAPRLAEDRPFDDIAVGYLFDDLALTAGTQRALFGAVGARVLAWQRDRWEQAPAGDHRRFNAGAALGGERAAWSYAGGDAITIPRHVAAHRVATYVSTTRHAIAAGALRWLASALPLVPRSAAERLAPYTAPDADYARTQLAVVTQVRRGFSSAQIVVRGRDLYRTTAVITAWAARHLVERRAGPVGVRAPGELFHGAAALRELAARAELAIEPSFS